MIYRSAERGKSCWPGFEIILLISLANAEQSLSLLQVSSSDVADSIEVCVAYDGQSFGFNVDIPTMPDQSETAPTVFKFDDHYAAGSNAFCKNDTNGANTQVQSALSIVKRGVCAFQEKAEFIKTKNSAATGVINVNYDDDSDIFPPGVENETTSKELSMFLGMISKHSYEMISNFAANSGGMEAIRGSLYVPEREKKLDLTLVPIFLIAVTCIGIGTYLSGVQKAGISTDENRRISSDSDACVVIDQEEEEDEQKFTSKQVLIWLCVTTLWLLLLYFFYDYLVFFMIGIFCLCGSTAMITILYNFVCMRLKCTDTLKCPSNQNVVWRYCDCIPATFIRSGPPVSLVLLTIACFGMSITWAIFRHSDWAWVLQDIIGFFFCVFTITELRFPSFKILFALQFAFCFYDVFMVYITPYLTPDNESVMVYVATGGGSKEKIPFLFLVPHFVTSKLQDLCMSQQYSMLGYGDIIIPGFTGGYCSYFDLLNSHAHLYYYWTFLVSYGVGLVLTFLALLLTGSGQPALFFLVPCTVGALIVLSYIRGELRPFWNGPKVKEKGAGKGA